MRPEHRYFDVSPVVVPADAVSTIRIRTLYGHCGLGSRRDLDLTYYPCEEKALRSGWPEHRKPQIRRVDGAIEFDQYFEGEQEHVLILSVPEEGRRGRSWEFRIYSVEPDLLGRLPWKGDVHMHSCRSDGREDPAYVAAACRSIGLDFMALTDHRRYLPSLMAMAAFRGVPCDLRIYPGEEIHLPDNPVHMVNFGGRRSINALGRSEAYRSEVAAVQKTLSSLPEGVDPYQYASCLWCFRRIRETGGLGIFCHPYWFTDHRYTPSAALTSWIFETQIFDAYEIIGGYHLYEVASNTLQVARYHEERAMGRRIPIVGVSDAHGCERGELFGWYYTIVFAPSADYADLSEAIRECWSVAVEALPAQEPRAYGPFRLVKYALFLMREVFPLHDELCVEEGRLMRRWAAGNVEAASGLQALAGRTATLYSKLFAGADGEKQTQRNPVS